MHERAASACSRLCLRRKQAAVWKFDLLTGGRAKAISATPDSTTLVQCVCPALVNEHARAAEGSRSDRVVVVVVVRIGAKTTDRVQNDQSV